MNKISKHSFFIVSLIFFLSLDCHAGELRPAAIFNDNMVLQRGKEIRIWGEARPETSVSVEFASQKVSTVSEADGTWTVFLPKFSECASPQTMVIESGDEHVTFGNILIGDVWLASGQSNMLMRVNSLTKEDREAVMSTDDNEFRYTQITPVVEGGKTMVSVQTGWESPHSENMRPWSAVSVYFAKELRKATGVPIGIICCAQGGSNIEAWIDKDFAVQNSLTQHFSKDYPENHIYSNYKNSSSLYESMLSPIIGYGIKGVIWYQGEANAKTGMAQSYHHLLAGLIQCWREKWDEPALPFGIVQLPNYGNKETSGSTDQSWAIVRQAQKEVCENTSMTAMAVTIGIGEDNDIHPKNKEEVGKRLASAVLSRIYGMKKYPASPEFGAPELSGNRITIPAKGKNILRKAANIDGFEICTDNGEWQDVKANVLRDRIVLTTEFPTEEVSAIRYAWKNTAQPTVFSKAGIPASPMILYCD